METSYVISQLDIIRRTAERALARLHDPKPPYLTQHSYIDLFQHIVDEVERTKKHIEELKNEIITT